MSWILFSLLAAFIWAMVNIVDKFVLTKWVRKPLVPVMFTGVIGLFAGIIVFFVKGFSALSFLNILWAFAAGICYILLSIFYYKAVKLEEISRIIPLFHITPIFILILASFFLGEIFVPIKYLGIFFLIIGAILISSKNHLKIRFSKSFWFMILACLALAANTVITKYLLNFADFWTIFSYIRIGSFIGVIPLFYFYYDDLVLTVKENGKKVVGVLSLNDLLNLVGVLCITIATASGFVTLVNALSSVQPFFVILFAVLLSFFFPKILKEEIGKSTIALKLVAIVLMFIGAVLIT